MDGEWTVGFVNKWITRRLFGWLPFAIRSFIPAESVAAT